jgi:hypothetical protein
MSDIKKTLKKVLMDLEKRGNQVGAFNNNVLPDEQLHRMYFERTIEKVVANNSVHDTLRRLESGQGIEFHNVGVSLTSFGGNIEVVVDKGVVDGDKWVIVADSDYVVFTIKTLTVMKRNNHLTVSVDMPGEYGLYVSFIAEDTDEPSQSVAMTKHINQESGVFSKMIGKPSPVLDKLVDTGFKNRLVALIRDKFNEALM